MQAQQSSMSLDTGIEKCSERTNAISFADIRIKIDTREEEEKKNFNLKNEKWVRMRERKPIFHHKFAMFNTKRAKLKEKERTNGQKNAASSKWIMHYFITRSCWIWIVFTISMVSVFLFCFALVNSFFFLHYISWYLVWLDWEHVRDWLLNSPNCTFFPLLCTIPKWNATRVRRQRQRWRQ